MSRRKTEAWLAWDDDGPLGAYLTEEEACFIQLAHGRPIPLVRRDPQAEAVVRAAVKWRTENPFGSSDLADAIDALRASRKAKR